MLKIRLTRVGKRNSPAYRVVIADKRRAVKGKFIEIIGNYNPTLKPKQIVIDKERALFWLERGAQASDTVNNLMCDLEILPKKKKVKITYGKKFTKKALKAGADKKPEKTEVVAETPVGPSVEAEAEVKSTPTELEVAAEAAPAEETEAKEAPAEEPKN